MTAASQHGNRDNFGYEIYMFYNPFKKGNILQ